MWILTVMQTCRKVTLSNRQNVSSLTVTCKLPVDNKLFSIREFDTNHSMEAILVLSARYKLYTLAFISVGFFSSGAAFYTMGTLTLQLINNSWVDQKVLFQGSAAVVCCHCLSLFYPWNFQFHYLWDPEKRYFFIPP